jgi:NAD-dependent dihydropyrimidine dehydrogenase PreA subunit
MIRKRVDYGITPGCLKSPWVATVDFDDCNGCGVCVQRCQFGAIKFEVTTEKTNVDQFKCFGCGLCETACPTEAIDLLDRESLPALKEGW